MRDYFSNTDPETLFDPKPYATNSYVDRFGLDVDTSTVTDAPLFIKTRDACGYGVGL